MSPILVTLTSHSDSNFERSNFSFKENKPDGVDPNCNGSYYYVRKKEGRTLRLSADCFNCGCRKILLRSDVELPRQAENDSMEQFGHYM